MLHALHSSSILTSSYYLAAVKDIFDFNFFISGQASYRCLLESVYCSLYRVAQKTGKFEIIGKNEGNLQNFI
jgi:hypothetical protein